MSEKVRIIEFPTTLDFSYGSKIWDFATSDAFAKLRCHCEEDLSKEELTSLRREFEKYTFLREKGDGSYEDRYAVNEGEELSVLMMKEAAYKLTSLCMKS